MLSTFVQGFKPAGQHKDPETGMGSGLLELDAQSTVPAQIGHLISEPVDAPQLQRLAVHADELTVCRAPSLTVTPAT